MNGPYSVFNNRIMQYRWYCTCRHPCPQLNIIDNGDGKKSVMCEKSYSHFYGCVVGCGKSTIITTENSFTLADSTAWTGDAT